MSFSAERRELLDRYLAAHAAGDAGACAVLYTEDGRILSPFGPPAIGRAAIREVHRDWFAAEEENKRFDVLSSACQGNLAYAPLAHAADTPAGPEAGIGLNVLSRGEDGAWRFHLTSLNADVTEAQ